MNSFTTHIDQDKVLVRFAEPRQVLSSAELSGGLVQAGGLANVRVDENFCGMKKDFSDPGLFLQSCCEKWGMEGTTVGMMTAASMKSFSRHTIDDNGVEIDVLCTTGLSNAGTAGDPASWTGETPGPKPGTINIFALTNAVLPPKTMVEAVAMVTEAKTVALRQLKAVSVSTGHPATGTGTDSIAVVSGLGPAKITYCGKHTLFGHLLAKAAILALTDSLSWNREKGATK